MHRSRSASPRRPPRPASARGLHCTRGVRRVVRANPASSPVARPGLAAPRRAAAGGFRPSRRPPRRPPSSSSGRVVPAPAVSRPQRCASAPSSRCGPGRGPRAAPAAPVAGPFRTVRPGQPSSILVDSSIRRRQVEKPESSSVGRANRRRLTKVGATNSEQVVGWMTNLLSGGLGSRVSSSNRDSAPRRRPPLGPFRPFYASCRGPEASVRSTLESKTLQVQPSNSLERVGSTHDWWFSDTRQQRWFCERSGGSAPADESSSPVLADVRCGPGRWGVSRSVLASPRAS